MAEDASKDDALNEDPSIVAEVDRQLSLIKRGIADMIGEDQLRAKIARSLKSGKPLRVKLGVDPTAHDLHLGFTLPLSKLRIFSDLGHKPVLIIGDATAMVGDPTGRNKARPQLTREMVDDYSKSYLDQASKILDMDKVEVRRNSEWLHELGFNGLIALVAKVTVAQILVRDDFAKRYEAGTPIYLHEFIYPLMQGYDSVVVEADVELGGHDQLFNLLVGRDLQRDAGQEEQACILNPLLLGLDGSRKMSKSFQNFIGVSEAPNEMFGKVMSIPDSLMRDYFVHLTSHSIDEIEKRLSSGDHPRQLKDELGRAIVSRFWSGEDAARASENFLRVVSNKENPDDMPEVNIAEYLEDGHVGLIQLVVQLGFAPSNSEARRLIQQGGVKLDGEALTDPKARISPQGGQVIKVGKRKFARLML